MKITGTLINYYLHCKKQCWLYANKLNMETNSEDVWIGRVLHIVNKRRVKEVYFENIGLDKITDEYVIEIKKSDSDLEAAKWQLLYYLYRLSLKGVKRKGRVEVFEGENKKRFEVILDEKSKKELLKILENIEKLTTSSTPPQVEYSSKCDRCAYYEYCFL